MGIILNAKVFLRNMASSSSDTRKSKTPFIMKEALVSPGCTLEDRMMDFLTAMSTGSDKKLVTISISTSLPARDLQRTVFLILSLLLKVQIFLMNSH